MRNDDVGLSCELDIRLKGIMAFAVEVGHQSSSVSGQTWKESLILSIRCEEQEERALPKSYPGGRRVEQLTRSV